ncbi:MAG: FecR domain-containing protein [Porticoccaceae bacterium]|jgi:transmembrane sensor
MSRIYEFPDQDRVNDEASRWLARLERGLSPAENTAFQQWMMESRQHRQTLFAMAELWDKMDSLSRLSDLFPPVTRKPPTLLGYAASITLIFTGVLLGWFLLQPEGGKTLQGSLAGNGIYETSVGGHSLVNLPDNSKALLNTDSLIQAHYNDQQRYIVLERGEVHFTVTKDKSRPFIVHAGDKVIQAVGTAFNVKMSDDKVVALVVTDGQVAVADKIPPTVSLGPEPPPILLSQDSPTVSQGEAAMFDASEIHIQKIAPEQIAVNLSWQQGNIIFQGETLEDAIREISRYTNIKFEIVDTEVKKVRVAGLFKPGDINGLLVTLYENFNISSQKIGEERILLGVNNINGESSPAPRS